MALQRVDRRPFRLGERPGETAGADALGERDDLG